MPSHLLRTSQRKVRIAASMTSAARTMVIPLVNHGSCRWNGLFAAQKRESTDRAGGSQLMTC